MPAPPVIFALDGTFTQGEALCRRSFVAQVARGSIVDSGPGGNLLALDAAAQLCKGAAASAVRRIQ